METNRVYTLDCLDGLKALPADYVNLTVTSPPYDSLREYKGFSVDFSGIINELYRVTKIGGIVVWVVGDATVKGSETGTSFRQALAFMDAGFRLHDTMIYEKANPVPCVSNRYQPSFEYMFVFSKGKPATFNAIKVPKKYEDKRESTKFNRNVDGTHVKGKTSTDSMRLKKNIWTYAVGKHHTSVDEEAFEHPAVFPEKLAEDHVVSWSNPGDIVLDIFSGSGTVLKAAMLNNRKFIGFEISEEYSEIIRRRLNKYAPEGRCYCGGEAAWMNDYDEHTISACFDCGNEILTQINAVE